MLTANCDAVFPVPSTLWSDAAFPMHTCTSGGSRLTEQNAVTVMP